MPTNILRLFDNRTIYICSFAEWTSIRSGEPFAVLLPAFEQDEYERAESIVTDLLAAGCVEFSCVGRHAEALHDTIDEFCVHEQRLGVLTTWHLDSADACKYFVFGSERQAGYALIASHSDLVQQLTTTASSG